MLHQIALRLCTSVLTSCETQCDEQESGASLFWGGVATLGVELTWRTPCVMGGLPVWQ